MSPSAGWPSLGCDLSPCHARARPHREMLRSPSRAMIPEGGMPFEGLRQGTSPPPVIAQHARLSEPCGDVLSVRDAPKTATSAAASSRTDGTLSLRVTKP